MARARKISDKRRKKSEEAVGSASIGKSAGGYYAINGLPFKRFEVQKGRNTVDVIPYYISNEQHPHILKDVNELECLEYNLDVPIHRSVGEDKVNFICLKDAGIEPTCFLCTEMWDLWKKAGGKGADKKAAAYGQFSTLLPSRRWIILLRPITGPQAGQITWWDAPYTGKSAGWGEQLEKKIKILKEEEGEVIDFVSLDLVGCSISFRADKEEDANWFDYSEFQFPAREEPVTDELVEGITDLSTFMIVCNSKEMQAYYTDGTIPAAFGNKAPTAQPVTNEETSPAPGVQKTVQEEEPGKPASGAKGTKETTETHAPATQTAEAPAEPESKKAEKPLQPEPVKITLQEETKETPAGECPEGRLFGVKEGGYRKCPGKKTCDVVNPCFQATKAK
jgi:hypothetical protein